MNILIINHYAGNPELGMEFRPYYFAREWVKKGHSVSIIGASYSHIRRVNPIVKKDFQNENISGIDYYWIKTGKYDSNGIKRAITMFEFISKLWVNAKKIVKDINPDVVICSSTYPLDTYVGQKIKRLSAKNVLLVHEIHDMWPLSPIEIGGMSPNHPFIKIMQMAENSFCRNSDKIVSLLPAAKDYLIDHGMKGDKFEVVMNGVLLEDWKDSTELPEKIVEHFNMIKQSGKLNICFCGSIHKSYGLEPFIEAVLKTEGVYATFIGPGLDKKELEDRTKENRDKVRFFDPIPKTSIPKVFEYIDASYVGSLPYSLNRFGICMNKLFDSMMGGKPILYAVDAPNNYIEEYDCGISVDVGDEGSIIDGINKLKNMEEKERLVMGNNGRKAALENFNYKVLSEKFMHILTDNIYMEEN